MILKKRELNIPSGKEYIYKVEQFIEAICDELNISNNYFGNISIGVLEAIENAIVHGNKNDSSREVKIKFEFRPGKLIFRIADQGKGFDYQNVTDPTEVEEDELKEAGRGLFVMRLLADNVEYNERGNEVKLTYEIKGISEEIVESRRAKLLSYSRTEKKIKKEE